MSDKQSGAGRPPGSTSRKPTRDTIKQIRWTAEEWAEIERRAESDGMTPSKWIRSKCLQV